MYREDELKHYGVKGMKWGVRRRREALNAYSGARKSSAAKTGVGRRLDAKKAYNKSMKDSNDANKNIVKDKWNNLSDKQKKAIKIGAAAAGTALAAYGAYKLGSTAIRNKNFELSVAKGKVEARNYLDANRNNVVGLSVFKDGTSTVEQRYGNGNRVVTKFASEKAGRDFYKSLNIKDDLAERHADRIIDNHVSRAQNATLREATRNVADHYTGGRVSEAQKLREVRATAREATARAREQAQMDYINRSISRGQNHTIDIDDLRRKRR